MALQVRPNELLPDLVDKVAGAALTAYRAVKLDGGGNAVAAGVADVALGVTQTAPGMGGTARVVVRGRTLATAAEALVAGDAVAPAAGGQLRKVQSGDTPVGRVLTAASGVGALFLLNVDQAGGAGGGGGGLPPVTGNDGYAVVEVGSTAAFRAMRPEYIQPWARFFLAGTTQRIYVRAAGSDTLGDGLTVGTAYATAQRALEDVPNGFTCFAVVDLGAGTDAAQQNWAVASQPGFMDPAGTLTGRIYIVGNSTSPDLTLASTGVGALVSGKRAQVRFSVGAYGASITDGSHWLRVTDGVASGVDTALVCLASTSPSLDVVTTLTTAMTTVTVNPYTTEFSGTVRIAAPAGTAFGGGPFVFVQGIKFSGVVQANNVQWDGCLVTALPVMTDCQVAALAVVGASVSFGVTAYARRNVSNLLVKDGGLALTGMTGALLGCVFRGSSGSGPKVGAGFAGTVPGQIRAPSGANLFQDCDLEGAGDGVWLSQNSTLGNGASGTSVTFALTSGRAVLLDHGSRLVFGNGTHAWTGTATLPSIVRGGSVLVGASSVFGVTNTTTPGEDVLVGSLPVVALDDYQIDLGDFSRYQVVGGAFSPDASAVKLDTGAIVAGSFVYVDAANHVAMTDAAAEASARCVGVVDAISGEVKVTKDSVFARFTTAGGMPANGAPVFLAVAADDAGTAAGKATATAPTGAPNHVTLVGVCADNSNYGAAKVCRVLLNLQPPVARA